MQVEVSASGCVVNLTSAGFYFALQFVYFKLSVIDRSCASLDKAAGESGQIRHVGVHATMIHANVSGLGAKVDHVLCQ